MYKGATVGVVVPAYNEEAFIGEVIQSIPDFVDRIYVVDDASKDGTWDEIRRHAAGINGHGGDRSVGELSPRLVPLRHDTNRGVGGAVKTGYVQALADGLDVTAVMDGDGQMDPEELPRLIDPIVKDEADYAKGTRLHSRRDRTEMGSWRLFGNWLLTMLTRASSGYWGMTDPQNGYRVISREALATIPFESAYEKHGFLNDILALLNVYGFRIADVSHSAVYGEEDSDIDFISFVPELSWLLLQRYLWRLKTSYLVRGFHPLVVCYPIGLGALLLGVGSSVYALLGYEGSTFLGGLASTMVTLFGVLLTVLAVWFDVEENDDLVTNVDISEVPETLPGSEEVHETQSEIELASDGGHHSQPTEASDEEE